MLLLALLGAGLYLRGRARSSTPQDQPLSPEESRRLAEILDE